MKNLEKESTYDLISQLARREEINPEKIIEIVSDSFERAYKSDESNLAEINISFDHEKKEFLAYSVYNIVEKVQNQEKEILSSDSRLNSNGSFIKQEKAFLNIDLKNLPKLVGYEIRKNIEKFIIELRREKQYQNFLPLKGEIVSGYIQNVQENFCIINLGKGLGYWDKKEWNFGDGNYLGKHMRFLLVEVQEKSDLKQLVLSRKSEEFIRKLFEAEIPEIKEGSIEIEEIIRVPDLVSKVIVRSNKFKLDPVGTCIGKKGSRIRSISIEMKKERIDLVAWREDERELLFNLLSPVEVISLVKKEDRNYTVFVPEHRMALALHGGGKMIQRISEYLDINLHIKSFEKSQDDSDVIVWNGNINFNDYEIKRNLFSSKQKQLNINNN